jgi:hypothetical protein
VSSLIAQQVDRVRSASDEEHDVVRVMLSGTDADLDALGDKMAWAWQVLHTRR